MRALMAAALAVAMLTGCSDPKLQERVAALESRASILEQQNSDLTSRIDSLELDKLIEGNGVATVSTTEPGYGIAKSRLGVFTIAVDKAVPYLAGFKVTLRIGNVTSATFNGAKLTVRWRPAARAVTNAAAGTPAPPETTEKEIKILEKLHPGVFNYVEIVLSPVTAEDIKTLWIAIETDGILMRRT